MRYRMIVFEWATHMSFCASGHRRDVEREGQLGRRQQFVHVRRAAVVGVLHVHLYVGELVVNQSPAYRCGHERRLLGLREARLEGATARSSVVIHQVSDR
jgi:hypothetical protein